MITNHFFNLIQCYSEVGDCSIGYYSFNIMLLPVMYLALIGLIILSLLFTIIIFLKLGRPSNWFKDYDAVEPEQHLDSVMSQGEGI